MNQGPSQYSYSDIITFLNKVVGITLISDQPFQQKESEQVLDFLFQALFKIGLMQQNSFYQKMALKFGNELVHSEITLMLKFMIVREIFKQFFLFRIGLQELIACKESFIKQAFGYLIAHNEKVNSLMSKFEAEIELKKQLRGQQKKLQQEIVQKENEITSLEQKQ